MITCLQFAPFAAAIEQRDLPALRGKPLVLVKDEKVYATCEQGLHAGIQPHISLAAAQSFCPEARLHPARVLYYEQVLTEVIGYLDTFSSFIEPILDPQRASCYVGFPQLRPEQAVPLVQEIGRRVRKQVHLAPKLGVAQGKFTAHVAAASVKPNRGRVVPQGSEPYLLAPQSIDTLPLGPDALRRLHRLGIRTLGQFAALPSKAVLAQFGRAGQQAHKLARGEDTRAVRPRFSKPTAQATHLFTDPTTSRPSLEAVTHLLAAQLADQLRAQRVQTSSLWLIVRLEDRTTRERRRMLREPTSGSAAVERALQGLLWQLWIHCPVVEVTAQATDWVPLSDGARQLDLLASEQGRVEHLRKVLPTLGSRYGADRFLQVSIVEEENHLPEQQFHLDPIERL